jgi:hypothetical protein
MEPSVKKVGKTAVVTECKPSEYHVSKMNKKDGKLVELTAPEEISKRQN